MQAATQTPLAEAQALAPVDQGALLSMIHSRRTASEIARTFRLSESAVEAVARAEGVALPADEPQARNDR